MTAYIFLINNDDILDIDSIEYEGNVHTMLYEKYSSIYGSDIKILAWTYQDFTFNSSVDQIGYLQRIVKMIKELFSSDLKVSMRTYGVGRIHYDSDAFDKISARITSTPCISRPTMSAGRPASLTILTQGAMPPVPSFKRYRRGPLYYGHSMLYA